MNRINYFFALLCLCVLASVHAAEVNSPVGLWKAHDDQGKPTGYIRIREANGI